MNGALWRRRCWRFDPSSSRGIIDILVIYITLYVCSLYSIANNVYLRDDCNGVGTGIISIQLTATVTPLFVQAFVSQPWQTQRRQVKHHPYMKNTDDTLDLNDDMDFDDDMYTYNSDITIHTLDEDDDDDKAHQSNHYEESTHRTMKSGMESLDDMPSNDLPEGVPKGFYIVKQYMYLPNDENSLRLWNTTISTTPDVVDSQSNLTIINFMNEDHIHHLGLSDIHNITLPIALTILDPITYPSLSRARKACRKGNVVIQRSNSTTTLHGRMSSTGTNTSITDVQAPFIGRVGDRVYSGDTIAIQVRMGDGYRFAGMGHSKPPFDVPVIYQDDYYALVNKPAGIVCYRQGSGSPTGYMSIRAALPFVLDPPRRGTFSVLRRPASVHRLDKPTSGLLCIVKTKPAMVHMSKQFHDRLVQKTYTAIINGIPEENSNAWITAEKAILEYGVDCDVTPANNGNNYNTSTPWQLIDAPLDGQSAVTLWRVQKYVPSLRARDGYLTLIECQPQTGRYHQLRRHMAWIANRPMVGDVEYDGNHPSARALRGNGLFLCATGIIHEHPYYNTIDGRLEWNKIRSDMDDVGVADHLKHHHNNHIVSYNTATDQVMVSAKIEPPTKFQSLLQRESDRYHKFHTSSNPSSTEVIPLY